MSSAVVRCPGCSKPYRLPSRSENRAFPCRHCGEAVTFTASSRRSRAAKSQELTWVATAVRVGAVVAALSAVGWFYARGPTTPHERLFAALDREYLGIIEVISRIEFPGEAEAVQPDLVRRVGAVNDLLSDPEPFGTPRAQVAPAVWERHGEALSGRLTYLRRQKSRVFNIPGEGRYLSTSLSQLPQVEKILRERLQGEPDGFDGTK